MPSPKIRTFREITPLIYSWTTPDIPKYAGWEKIGYTEQESADARIAQQASQLSVDEEEAVVAAGPVHVGGRWALHGQGLPRLPAPTGRGARDHAEADRVASLRDRAEDVAGVLQRLRRPGLPQPPEQRRGRRLRPASRAAGGRRPGRGGLRGREGRGAVERQATVRQDADDVRPDADPGRPAGLDRHQPPGDRELLVRRLHALHRPPDDVPVRLRVALTGQPFAHDSRAVACLLAQPSGRGPAHRGVPLAAGPQGVAVLRRLVRQAQAHRSVRLGPAGDRRGPRGHRHHQDRRRVRPDQAQVDAALVGHAVQGAGLRQVRPGPDLQLDVRGRAGRPPAVGGRRRRRTRTRRCRRSTC